MSQLKEIFFNLATGASATETGRSVPKIAGPLLSGTLITSAAIAGAARAFTDANDGALFLAAVAATTVTTGAGLVSGLLAKDAADSTRDNNSSLSNQSQKTLQKIGVGLLTSFSLVCGSAAAYYTYKGEVETQAINDQVTIQLDDPKLCVYVYKNVQQAKAAAGECPATPAVK